MPRASDPLFARLVDDAALFPPRNATMPDALAEHAAHRSAWYADAVGPFVCPASRLDELRATLPAEAPDHESKLALSLLFDVFGEGAHAALRDAGTDPRLVLVGIEAALARLGGDAITIGTNLARIPAATAFLEVPRTGFDAALDLVAGSGWHGAKFRTGGVTADAFPTEAQLASFLVACASRGLAVKLTAGLHHAVRTHTGEGFEAHGLLNVLVSTRVAQQGGAPDMVAAVLAERSPDVLIAFVQDWDNPTCIDVRRVFRSFGCCAVTDPLEELARLGLLDGPE